METGRLLRVSSDRLEEPGIEPGTPGYKAGGTARQGFIVYFIQNFIKTYILDNQNKQELIFVIAFSSFLTFSNSSLAPVSIMPPVLTGTSSNLVTSFRTGIKSCPSSNLGQVRLFVSEKFVLEWGTHFSHNFAIYRNLADNMKRHRILHRS